MQQAIKLSRRVMVCWWVLIAVLLLGHHARVVAQGQWGQPKGDEYKDIAMSLAQGGGFSFPGPKRWLFQDQRKRPGLPAYGTTAWKEPISTGWMALWYRMLGERGGGIALVLWQTLLWAGACVLTAILGKRLFSQPVGMVAATLLAASPYSAHACLASIQGAPVGAVLLLVLLLALLAVLKQLTALRCAGLGLLLGLSALNLAALLLFSLVIAVALMGRALAERSVKPIALLALTALVCVATIAPWTARNYKQFGHVVLVQNGLGNFAYYSNPLLARTYDPSIKIPPTDDAPLPFASTGPFDAAMKLTNYYHSTDLMLQSIGSVADHPPAGWEDMNETERDKVFLGHFKQFVADHPDEFAKLVASKCVIMVIRPTGLIPLVLLSAVGLVVTIRRPGVWLLPTSVVLYSLPFLITAPLYYRYRFPIEPLLMLLAAVPMVWLVQKVIMKKRTSGPSFDK